MHTITRLSLGDAQRLIADGLQRAAQIGVPMCIAVADESGTLIAFARADAAKVTSVAIAIDKAFTAAGAQMPTGFYGDEQNPQSPTWRIQGTNGGRFVTLRGGVPIRADGVIVGAIGVSGGTGPEDLDVAEWALARFAATIAHVESDPGGA
jgi:uncharacterized protein GlcG (DUF336 family)